MKLIINNINLRLILVMTAWIATTDSFTAPLRVPASRTNLVSNHHSRNTRLPGLYAKIEPETKAALEELENKKSFFGALKQDIINGEVSIAETEKTPSEIYETAIRNTLFAIGSAGAFGTLVWGFMGSQAGQEYFAGYLVEQSLSVDNLFVFLLLFEYFKVPVESQNRVLSYGIIGAIVMRALMIGVGIVALESVRAIILVFAGILVFSSYKILFDGDEEDEEDMSENAIVQFSSKLIKTTDKYDGDKFFTIEDGIKKATPLLVCLISLELSDIVFAVDSVPAVLGVTEDPLVVFSSNIFAILGLRSIYTVLAEAASELEYLEPAVAIVLGFIGAKMIAGYFGTEVSTTLSLAVVASLLIGGVGLSILKKNDVNGNVEQ